MVPHPQYPRASVAFGDALRNPNAATHLVYGSLTRRTYRGGMVDLILLLATVVSFALFFLLVRGMDRI